MSEQWPTAITITRQMSSGGSYIGRRIAKRLGFYYLDRYVLEEAAHQLSSDISEIEASEEKTYNIWQEIIKSFTFGTPEAAYIPPSKLPVYDKTLFEKESEIIRKIASTTNVVVVGRGAVQALRMHPKVLHIFIHAPKPFRIKRLMRNPGIPDEKAAYERILEADERKNKFFEKIVGLEWLNAKNYHLCMDTSKTGFHDAEEIIVSLVGKLKGG